MPNPYVMDITLWSAGANDGHGGVAFGSPLALKGRWEDKQEEFLNPQNEAELSNAVIFFPDGYSPKIGDYVFNGTSVATDPSGVHRAFEIKQVLRTPDIRNCRSELRVIL